MNFDINEVTANMLSAVQGTLKEDWDLVKKNASIFIQNRKLRLELLTQMRIAGEISNDFFAKRLEDEKQLLVSELHAMVIINKVAAQNAANAAIKVLEDAVKVVL